MPPFPEDCTSFFESCDKKYNLEEVIRLLVTTDSNGCPALRTNGPTAADVQDLTNAIQALTAAISAM